MFTLCTGIGHSLMKDESTTSSKQDDSPQQSIESPTDGATEVFPSQGNFILSNTEAQPATRLPDASLGLDSALSLDEHTALLDDYTSLSSLPSSSVVHFCVDHDGATGYDDVIEPCLSLHLKKKCRTFKETTMNKECHSAHPHVKNGTVRTAQIADGKMDYSPSQHMSTDNSLLADHTISLPSGNSYVYDADDEERFGTAGNDNQPVVDHTASR